MLAAALALVAATALGPSARAQAAACAAPSAVSAADRYSGAYRTAEGAVISVLPQQGAPGRYRITHFQSGRSHLLHPAGAAAFESAGDLDSQHPVAHRYTFIPGDEGTADRLRIDSDTGPTVSAHKVPLIERPADFRSADTGLRGRLTLPALPPPAALAQQAPARAVVFVHGSDAVPSAGYEWLPHLLATSGIATLVFDKRGTGCSQGRHVQHFGVLAEDVAAAVRWLAAQPGIDAQRIGLAGFSQGGWVAPLAALQAPAVKFVAVGYGLAMSMADEDRLEAPLKLKAAGVDDASIEEFKALNAVLHDLARSGFGDWQPFERALERARERPWFALAERQQSWLGVTMQMGLEQAKAVAPRMFTDFFQPFHDPVPTLEQLRIPMLWLMAGQDIEAPPQPTLDVLARLQRLGRPVSVVVFPEADHGIQDFVIRDGVRVRTKYSDGYFSTLLAWLLDPR